MSGIEKLMAFLDGSPSCFHAVANLTRRLEEAGYTPLSEAEDWQLLPGGKYYLTRNQSALIAFRVPQGKPQGFMLSASHSDRPCFKIKENPELETAGVYLRLAVERYGGMLMAPWLDRPLSAAGRVLVETAEGIRSCLVDLDRDLCMIPHVAIHMNRKANEGYSYNPAVDLIPLLGSLEARGTFRELVAEAAGCRPEEILGTDLFLYNREKARIWGAKGEYLSARALDDLQCAWASLEGFLQAGEGKSIPVCCVFDNEEVGSNTKQGADSTFLPDTLVRICAGVGLHYRRALARSFLVSADNAHAVHPNHPEYADPNHRPVMNGGVVIKFNANQRYTTDGVSAALFRRACQKAGVPTQTFCNRADLPGGSTLGNISSSHVSIPTVDVGLPQLAMHSCYETAGVRDAQYLAQALAQLFSMSLTPREDGFSLEA